MAHTESVDLSLWDSFERESLRPLRNVLIPPEVAPFQEWKVTIAERYIKSMLEQGELNPGYVQVMYGNSFGKEISDSTGIARVIHHMVEHVFVGDPDFIQNAIAQNNWDVFAWGNMLPISPPEKMPVPIDYANRELSNAESIGTATPFAIGTSREDVNKNLVFRPNGMMSYTIIGNADVRSQFINGALISAIRMNNPSLLNIITCNIDLVGVQNTVPMGSVASLASYFVDFHQSKIPVLCIANFNADDFDVLTGDYAIALERHLQLLRDDHVPTSYIIGLDDAWHKEIASAPELPYSKIDRKSASGDPLRVLWTRPVYGNKSALEKSKVYQHDWRMNIPHGAVAYQKNSDIVSYLPLMEEAL